MMTKENTWKYQEYYISCSLSFNLDEINIIYYPSHYYYNPFMQ